MLTPAGGGRTKLTIWQALMLPRSCWRLIFLFCSPTLVSAISRSLSQDPFVSTIKSPSTWHTGDEQPLSGHYLVPTCSWISAHTEVSLGRPQLIKNNPTTDGVYRGVIGSCSFNACFCMNKHCINSQLLRDGGQRLLFVITFHSTSMLTQCHLYDPLLKHRHTKETTCLQRALLQQQRPLSKWIATDSD